MEIRVVPIGLLIPAPYNPRKDLQPEDPQYIKIKRSLEEFDIVTPLVWNERSGHVVGGHQRLKVLKDLKRTEVEVSVVDLDIVKEKALNVALNNIEGEWDNLKLRDLLNDLQPMDVLLTGFDQRELEAMNTSMDEFNPMAEWDGMPEFKQEDLMGRSIIVHFKNNEDILAFAKLVEQNITGKTKYIWYPFLPPESNLHLRYKDES